MSKMIDLTGQTFGYWKVISLSSSGANTHAKWLCECTLCGCTEVVTSSSLIHGRSTKCRRCGTRLGKTKSFANDPIKIIFKGMKQRCYNPNNTSYKNYGAKGITICEEWLNDPVAFYEWAYQHGYQKGLTIERKNINEGYSPDNCSFISRSEQSKNRSMNHVITIGDKTACLADWCKVYGINHSTVRARIKKGMTYEDALQTPVKNKQ